MHRCCDHVDAKAGKMNPIFYVIFSILLVTASQLLFKKGTVQYARQAPRTFAQRAVFMLLQEHIVAGVILNGIAAFFWLLALSSLELSFVFPFLSLNYILIPVLAKYFFRENLSKFRLIGIGVISIGIFLIALS